MQLQNWNISKIHKTNPESDFILCFMFLNSTIYIYSEIGMFLFFFLYFWDIFLWKGNDFYRPWKILYLALHIYTYISMLEHEMFSLCFRNLFHDVCMSLPKIIKRSIQTNFRQLTIELYMNLSEHFTVPSIRLHFTLNNALSLSRVTEHKLNKETFIFHFNFKGWIAHFIKTKQHKPSKRHCHNLQQQHHA